jgi:signal transduction histidine kinase/DNA-binding response OmpR family regulator/HAMP domain-containing protein
MPEALKFKHRIWLLVALASFALATVTGMALVLGRRGADEVSGIQTRYLPLLELNRDLQSMFAAIARTLEDAASAAEESGVEEADALRDRFLATLAAGQEAVVANGADPAALRREFQAYYELARQVASQLIAGQPGEDLLDKAQAMRTAQQRFAVRLAVGTTPDRARIAAAFDSARAAHQAVLEVDLIIASLAFALMLLLSFWIIRGTVRSLQAVSTGVERLADGDFSHEIEVAARDEFGELAREANRTAQRLREYRERAAEEDWVKTQAAGLAGQIAGEHDAAALGQRALATLAKSADAPIAALYAADEDCQLSLVEARAAGRELPAGFRPGEGILGQAARDDEVRLVSDLPEDYMRIGSALGETPVRTLLVVPFSFEGRCMGVLELGFLERPAPSVLELMRRSREALAIAFKVAESRQRVQTLVEEMHQQADELRVAYESAQAQNLALQESEQRLHSQQDELRAANEELEQQAEVLVAQRSAMVKQNQELQEAQRLIEEKASELARASRYKSEFLANMSHELRTPLNSIMLLARIMATNEDGSVPAKLVEFAQVIHKSGEELLALINDVLDLAKIEAGKQDIVFGPVGLVELAGYLRQMFEPLAGQKRLAFAVELAAGLPEEIQTDRMRLEQILKNLVSNAIKFTERGSVSILIERAGPSGADEAFSVAVSDTGAGIPADRRQLIFEAFAQADGGISRRHGGTGLGLTIARQLAIRLGGDIQVESEVGVGSTFVLTLPVREPRRRLTPTSSALRLLPRARTVPPPLADDRAGLTPGDPCFLVIEDDRDFGALLIDLIRQAGFRAVVAQGGRDGLDLARRLRPSGIILDVGLPDLDGWSVMERLQTDRATRDIPVHFISALGDPERASDLGAIGFLSKPVEVEQIRGAIRALQRPAASLSGILLVESDPDMREELRRQLAGLDTSITPVGSAEEALAVLGRAAFGVMVMGLTLPDSGGALALIERIRADPPLASLPIVVHSRGAPGEAEARALQRCRAAVVVMGGDRAMERLLDETHLFVKRVHTRLPGRKPAIEVVNGREAALEGKRVLIVDDDMRNVYSLSNALRSKRLSIIAAADGVEALEQLDSHTDTDIVLMDIMMPRMDGHEAIRRIREQPRFRKIPIIALTAKTMPGDRQKSIEAGANDFIPKPVNIDRLLSMIRVWLSA